MLNRRRFLHAVGVGMLTAPLEAGAQPVGKVFRVGVLTVESVDPLRQSLRDLGYIEGQNMALEVRNTEGRVERARDLAVELVLLKVDVIVATHPTAVFSAKRLFSWASWSASRTQAATSPA